MRLIDADALEKSICQDKCDAEECGMTYERDGAECCLEVQRVRDAPTIELVLPDATWRTSTVWKG